LHTDATRKSRTSLTLNIRAPLDRSSNGAHWLRHGGGLRTADAPMTAPAQLRILHLTAGSDAGGVSRYLHESCTRMAAKGHHVRIAGEVGAWHALFGESGIAWIQAPLKGGLVKLHLASRRLLGHLREQPVDLIHTHYRKSALIGGWLARRLGVPMLFTLHLTGIPMRGPWRWLSDFGDHTHAPSSAARQWLLGAGVPDARISVIPHGIDPQRFPLASNDDRLAARLKLGLSAGATVAAFVGRFDEPKNEDWLLDLAAAAGGRLPDLHLLLVGEGPHEGALRRRIEADGLAQRVRLLPYQDPLPVYQAIDALLLPSSQEGFSYVCTEAMCVGRPVLRTRTAGTHEHVIEGVTGASVPVDRQAFLDAATAFLSDRGGLVRMGGAAASHVREHLTIDRQIDATESLYRRLTTHRAAT
jgi:glycosyltransferase involved in cell wall biosynthesis